MKSLLSPIVSWFQRPHERPTRARADQRRLSNACPKFEGLERRVLFNSIVVGTDGLGKVVTFTGSDTSDNVTIKDNGAGRVVITTASASGPLNSTQSGVDHLVVNTLGGVDVVKYTLQSATASGTTRRLVLDVNLGGGSDQFTANLNMDINNRHTFNVQGGDGKDVLTVNADRDNKPDGIRIASLTQLNLSLLGGNQGDTINVSYQGDMDGVLSISALLDQFIDVGEDTADILVIMDSGSGQRGSITGTGILTLRVEGGFANDRVTALIDDHSAGNVLVDATVDAGEDPVPFPINRENDEVTFTDNVTVVNGETFNPSSPPAFANRMVTSPVKRGTPTRVSGIITEPNAGDTFYLDVNWRDHTPTQTFTFLPGTFVTGQTIAIAEHTYKHVGHYHIRLTWRDQSGLSNDDNTLVAQVLPRRKRDTRGPGSARQDCQRHGHRQQTSKGASKGDIQSIEGAVTPHPQSRPPSPTRNQFSYQ